jgi:hypothetical protein
MAIVLARQAERTPTGRPHIIRCCVERLLTQQNASGLLARFYHDIDSASDCRSNQSFRDRLLSSHCEGFAAVFDHLAHFTDAFRALGLALIASEDFTGTAGTRLDGEGDVTLAKTVTVANVQERRTRPD